MLNPKDVLFKSLRSDQRFKKTNNHKNKRDSKIFSSLLANKKLNHIAIKLRIDCYLSNIFSKELIRNFILAIERIRSEYDAQS